MSPTQSPIRSTRFAESDEEANDRYLAHKSVDPFPDIPPALLNSADLSEYVAKSGLIYPFVDSGENLKAAAYRVRILGRIVYWEAGGEAKSRVLGYNDQLILSPHSITYITLEPVFRIPDYMKVWFTLDASHVYKGLLLNSGFIDPGWVEQLVLPLHNPTANEYRLRARDSLIWITLMKISPRPQREQLVLFKTLHFGKNRETHEQKQIRKLEDDLNDGAGRAASVRSTSDVIPGNVPEVSTPPASEPVEKVASSTPVPTESATTLQVITQVCEQLATTAEAVLKASAEIAAANQASVRTLTEGAAKIADAAATLAEAANPNRDITPPNKRRLGEFIQMTTLAVAILTGSATNIGVMVGLFQIMKKSENVPPERPPAVNRFAANDPTNPSPSGTPEPQRQRRQKRRASKRFTKPSTIQIIRAQNL